jgi:hypothetical protein
MEFSVTKILLFRWHHSLVIIKHLIIPIKTLLIFISINITNYKLNDTSIQVYI